jgi:hypothetical protein
MYLFNAENMEKIEGKKGGLQKGGREEGWDGGGLQQGARSKGGTLKNTKFLAPES